MDNCIFCNLKNNRIFEDNYFYAIFDAHPVSPGHALVIPKTHTVSLLGLNNKQWTSLKSAIAETIEVIESTDFSELYKKPLTEKPNNKSDIFCKKMMSHVGINKKPEGYNIGNNEGEAAGRTIHHLHIQIIPRYKGDVKNPIGGIRNIIPELGDYKN